MFNIILKLNCRDQLKYLISATTGHQEEAQNLQTSWRPAKQSKPNFYRSDTETQHDENDGHHDTSGMHNGDTAFTNRAYRKDD